MKRLEVDPLTCPKCASQMRVISVIEQDEIIKKILKHLGLWDQKARPLPKLKLMAERNEAIIDESFSQFPCLPSVAYNEGRSDNWSYAGGHFFSAIDPEYPEVYPPEV